ncbi:S8 family serine peptidase [Clostridium sp. YIM B02515]|uniref:S8 family serine peptidase n=1 Tax=Clostridium rhizosphaerae TaxID=2803861 RepID=A0ABS1TAE5_9CLOT|nr:S8 family serine peptidase [Clostridium rhizosphaerae]MBL4936324.1 S8 family serine peptidase [Clostridium rhizosphaerae]
MFRKKKIITLLVCVALIVPQSVFSKGQNIPYGNSIKNHNKAKYVAGEVIIKYKNSVTAAKAKTDISKKYFLKHKKDLSINNAELLSVSDNTDVDTMINKLKQDENIEIAQPNYLYYSQDISSDERSSEEWGLENSGRTIQGSLGISGIDINIKKAWTITQGSEDVVVGVIDTGIDINHPELKNRIWINKNEIPGNGVDDDNNGYVDDVYGWDFYNNDNTVFDAKDGDKHGTHVAGTIAAEINSIGIVGVAPKVKIMPLKFIGPFGGTTDDAIRTISYAKQMGVKILNNSWGGSGDDTLLKQAIEASGSLFVVAAGNEMSNNDINPSFPAAYDSQNILSVASVNNKGNLSWFSNYGVNSTDVAAPGEWILSTIPKNDDIGASVEYDNGMCKTLVQGFSLKNMVSQSQREDMLKRALDFFKVTNSDSILLISDDESSQTDADSETAICIKSLSNLGYDSKVYYIAKNQDGPDSGFLKNYKLVLWMTGLSEQSLLTKNDQYNLSDYLDNGGNLYISGNYLSGELYQTDFAKNYLHINYLQNEDNRSSLIGINSTEYEGGLYDLYNNYFDMIEPSDRLGKIVLNYAGNKDYSNSYEYLSGTSMATPHVTGIAALLLSKGVDKPEIIKDKILLGVQLLSSLNGKVLTEGMANAYNSLRYIKDFNDDKKIDTLDLAALAKNYNMKKSDVDWNKIYDLNGDGTIDIFDLVLMSKDLGN